MVGQWVAEDRAGDILRYPIGGKCLRPNLTGVPLT